MFGKRIKPLIATSAKIQDAINKVYEKSTANLSGLDDIEDEDYDLDDPIVDLLEAGEDDAPVINWLTLCFFAPSKKRPRIFISSPMKKTWWYEFALMEFCSIFTNHLKTSKRDHLSFEGDGQFEYCGETLPQDGRIPLKVGGKILIFV